MLETIDFIPIKKTKEIKRFTALMKKFDEAVMKTSTYRNRPMINEKANNYKGRDYCKCPEKTQSIAYEKPFQLYPVFFCVTCGHRKRKQ